MKSRSRTVIVSALLVLSPQVARAQSLVDLLRGMADLRGTVDDFDARRRARDARAYGEDGPGGGFGVSSVPTGTDGGSRADPLMTLDPMHDTTLRPGDALMTNDGLSIFVGDPGADPHSPRDFVPATARGALDAKDRRRYAAAVPFAGEGAPSKRTATVGRSVHVDVVVGREVVDPRGAKVRYVGP